VIFKWKTFVCAECGHKFESNWLLSYRCRKCGHAAIVGSIKSLFVIFWIWIGITILVTIFAALHS
jgi:hypothetical protein